MREGVYAGEKQMCLVEGMYNLSSVLYIRKNFAVMKNFLRSYLGGQEEKVKEKRKQIAPHAKQA